MQLTNISSFFYFSLKKIERLEQGFIFSIIMITSSKYPGNNLIILNSSNFGRYTFINFLLFKIYLIIFKITVVILEFYEF